MSENELLHNLLTEVSRCNNNANELIRLQNELAKHETELFALEIRYVHKTKENEDLLKLIETKTKDLNEKISEYECQVERNKSLEFHFNDLLQKQKLFVDCIDKLKNENDDLKAKIESAKNQCEKITDEKSKLNNVLKDQIDELDRSLKKMINENEDSNQVIKDLRMKCAQYQSDLDKSNETNIQLIETTHVLEKEIERIKDKYNKDMSDSCLRLDSNVEKQTNLEIDLLKTKSRLDELQLQYNDLKQNYNSQLKIIDIMKANAREKESQYNELNDSYQKCLNENRNLIQISTADKYKYQIKMNDLKQKMETSLRLLESERDASRRESSKKEFCSSKVLKNLSNNRKLVETLGELCVQQETTINLLKHDVNVTKQKFYQLKSSNKYSKEQYDEKCNIIKNLRDKLAEYESKYTEQFQHVNNLEQELFLTKNSLDSALNDITSLTSVLTNKSQEILFKNQKIDHLESTISQLNNELNKRKFEINDRITQIEKLDKVLVEEKVNLDSKMSNLEENLRSKSKQLNQRTEQIKELSDLVDDLKQQKEELEYKLLQYDDIIKCQKLEIETKSNLIKKFEFRIEDANNEMNKYKNENSSKLQENGQLRNAIEEKSNEIYHLKQLLSETKLKIEQLKEEPVKQKPQLSIQYSMESKETQTIIPSVNQESLVAYVNDTLDPTNQSLNGFIEELKIDLQIKENLIESINDTLVLKEAEIARLKTRIGLLERQYTQQQS